MNYVMSGKQLAEKCVDVATHYKTLYVMGCFGAPMTEANKQRYLRSPAADYYNGRPDRAAMIRAADGDTFGFDCVCLIKGLCWGWSGDKTAVYGGARYASNSVPDYNANGMLGICKDVSTDFSKLEVGEALWLDGHIGVYVGGGLAVECTPKWANRVQLTAVGNLGAKAGYNTRTWVKHGKLPFVEYAAESAGAKASPEGQEKTAAAAEFASILTAMQQFMKTYLE